MDLNTVKQNVAKIKEVVKNANEIIILKEVNEDLSGISYTNYENYLKAIIRSKDDEVYKLELLNKKDDEYELIRSVDITLKNMKTLEVVSEYCSEHDSDELIEYLEKEVRELFKYVNKYGVDVEAYLVNKLSKKWFNLNIIFFYVECFFLAFSNILYMLLF